MTAIRVRSRTRHSRNSSKTVVNRRKSARWWKTGLTARKIRVASSVLSPRLIATSLALSKRKTRKNKRSNRFGTKRSPATWLTALTVASCSRSSHWKLLSSGSRNSSQRSRTKSIARLPISFTATNVRRLGRLKTTSRMTPRILIHKVTRSIRTSWQP